MELAQLLVNIGRHTNDKAELNDLKLAFEEAQNHGNDMQSDRFNWQRLRFYYCAYVDRTAFRKNKYLSLKLDEVINGLKAYLRSKS